jgi:Clp amino terminal domain, pathogenicity island component
VDVTRLAGLAVTMGRWEASRLHHAYVGPEHLLGLLRQGDNPAALVLVGHGLDLETVRTALPDAQDLADHEGRRRLVINNGSAGLANFTCTTFGVITRLSSSPQPPADSLYGISIDGLRCDAVALAFDADWWRTCFAAQWPPDSPASERYYTRITQGTPLRLQRLVE